MPTLETRLVALAQVIGADVKSVLERTTHYQQTFSNSAQWQVLHNLNRPVSVTVKDEFGNVVIAEVQHMSSNEFYVRFGSVQSGSVVYF